MATYGGGLKLDVAIAAASTAASGTLYTCPAGKAAWATLIGVGAGATLLINGKQIAVLGAGTSAGFSFACYLGAADVVSFTNSGGSSVGISGTQLSN